MDDDPKALPRGCSPSTYALSGKIMLSSIISVFIVVLLTVGFYHIFARWFVHRRRRLQRNLRRHSVAVAAAAAASLSPKGLEANIIKSLPTFVYSCETHAQAVECAVCLSEFEDSESGRSLPKCNHKFHLECISMWFRSHSNCPLCRAPVKTDPSAPVMETVASLSEPSDLVGSNSSVELVGIIVENRSPIEMGESGPQGKTDPSGH